MGSPTLYAACLDESINKHIASLAAAAHRLVWHSRLLTDFHNRYGVGVRSHKRKASAR